jgi:hypothetical protein
MKRGGLIARRPALVEERGAVPIDAERVRPGRGALRDAAT